MTINSRKLYDAMKIDNNNYLFIPLCLLLAVSLFNGCSDSPWEMEEDKEFVEGSRTNSEIEKKLEGLRGTRLGGALWSAASARLRPGFSIYFQANPSLPGRSMLYIGWGCIEYQPDGLQEGDFEQLAFHELFHIYQNGEFPRRVLNNEIEAYLAQYIFLVSIDRVDLFSTASSGLTYAIEKLAECIDLNTGAITSNDFNKWYDRTMRALKNCSLYQNNDGETAWVELPSREIAVLQLFLRNL